MVKAKQLPQRHLSLELHKFDPQQQFSVDKMKRDCSSENTENTLMAYKGNKSVQSESLG